VGRCLSGEAVFHEAEMLTDISGGVTATFPYEGDFVNEETKDLLFKYTKRNPDMLPEDQAQFWRYLGDMLCSATGGIHLIGAYHGGGSPIMEQIAITTQYDIGSRKKLVRHIAGMNDGDPSACDADVLKKEKAKLEN
jgi:aromatic ring hydroxylase